MYDHRLDTFILVVEKGSITAAARELYISQSAATRQISELENFLGIKLFKRTNRGMVLTKSGKILYSQSYKIINLCRDTIIKVQECDSIEFNSVIIAIGGMIYSCLYEMIDMFTEQYKKSKVSFKEVEKQSILDAVVKRKADICICCNGSMLRQSGLNWVPLFFSTECCLVSKKSSLACNSIVTVNDLKGHTVIMPPKGFADSSDRLYGRLESCPDVHIFQERNLDSNTLMQIVASDKKYADILLEDHVKTYPGTKVIPFEGSQALIGIAYGSDVRPSVSTFLELAKKWVFSDMGEGRRLFHSVKCDGQ